MLLFCHNIWTLHYALALRFVTESNSSYIIWNISFDSCFTSLLGHQFYEAVSKFSVCHNVLFGIKVQLTSIIPLEIISCKKPKSLHFNRNINNIFPHFSIFVQHYNIGTSLMLSQNLSETRSNFEALQTEGNIFW